MENFAVEEKKESFFDNNNLFENDETILASEFKETPKIRIKKVIKFLETRKTRKIDRLNKYIELLKMIDALEIRVKNLLEVIPSEDSLYPVAKAIHSAITIRRGNVIDVFLFASPKRYHSAFNDVSHRVKVLTLFVNTLEETLKKEEEKESQFISITL